MLHQQAHGGDAGPAHGAQSDWLSTGFYQFHQVAVQTDGGHGHGDEEFAQFLQRGKDFRGDTRHTRKGCNHRSDYEIQKEHRKCPLQAKIVFTGVGGFAGAVDGQTQSDWDDRQGSGEFYRYGFVQGFGAQVPHAVPGCGGCSNRGGVVDCRSRENAEGFAAVGVEADGSAQHREEDGSHHVEKEDDGNRLSHLFVVGIDDRCGGSDGRSATDGGTHAHQGGNVSRNVHCFVEHPRQNQRGGDGADDNRKGLSAGAKNHAQVHAEAQQHYRRLQDVLGGEFNSLLRFSLVLPEQGDDHAQQDCDYRASHHRKLFPDEPCRQCQQEADRKARGFFFNRVTHFTLV